MPDSRQHQDPDLVIPTTRYVVQSTLCLLLERIRHHLDITVMRTRCVVLSTLYLVPERSLRQDPDLAVLRARNEGLTQFCMMLRSKMS
jgi:hypothetical protein